MASASKLDKMNKMLRSVLMSKKGGVALNQLEGEYRDLTGDPLHFREFGYQSLEAFLKSVPDVASLQRGPDGYILCNAVADDSTKHIASLVSRQKGQKSKGRGRKPKFGRMYTRPTYASRPVYNHNPSYKPRPVRPKFQTSRPPTPQSYRPALSHSKLPRQQQFAKPVQQSANPADSGSAKPTQQFAKPLQSAHAKPANSLSNASDGVKPREQTREGHYKTTSSTSSMGSSTTQLPTPGQWSGKLRSKRNQQSAGSSSVDDKRPTDPSSGSTKPVYENIYITLDNDSYPRDKSPSRSRGRTKSAKGNVKPEWSSNFEVPPRFKKLLSPTGTTVECYRDDMSDDEDAVGTSSGSFADAAPSPTQPPPEMDPGAPQISSLTSDWIQKTLQDKPNGVWAGALRTMHQKEFGVALDSNIIEQMSKLSLIQKESIYNNDILYPKLTINVMDMPASTGSKRSVTFGAGDGQQEGAVTEKSGNQINNGAAHRNGASSVSPGAQSLSNNSRSDRSPRDSPHSSFPSVDQVAQNPSDAQFPSDTLPSFVPDEETPSEQGEECGSPTMEVPGVPSMQLPEENEWDLYVAYITSVSDFFAILIGDDYSEQLIILEEEMRTFYQCCTWTLTGPPEEGDCYAAEFNREWLRVEVKSIQGDEVRCFLLDHGDEETADVGWLRPLSDTFLQLPFQVIHCKLYGSEQVAEDDSTALQMFCQLALGKSLLAEVKSRSGDRVAMELFDDSDVSILEQCMTAGI